MRFEIDALKEVEDPIVSANDSELILMADVSKSKKNWTTQCKAVNSCCQKLLLKGNFGLQPSEY